MLYLYFTYQSRQFIRSFSFRIQTYIHDGVGKNSDMLCLARFYFLIAKSPNCYIYKCSFSHKRTLENKTHGEFIIEPWHECILFFVAGLDFLRRISYSSGSNFKLHHLSTLAKLMQMVAKGNSSCNSILHPIK